VAEGDGLLRLAELQEQAGNRRVFLPVFAYELGWRWLSNDGSGTAFGHTAGHTAADANVCLLSTRCATLLMVKYFAWDDAKNAKLKADRGIGFEDVVFHIERGDLLDILEAIQKRALEEGLPYQTLISSLLHKYAAGRLKEV
jgi:hypothetical protein